MKAEEDDKLGEVTKHQHINIRTVLKDLEQRDLFEDKMSYLELRYPCLSVYVKKKLGMKEDLRRYMENCRKLEKDYEQYSWYLHGYFIPWLEEQRAKGDLK